MLKSKHSTGAPGGSRETTAWLAYTKRGTPSSDHTRKVTPNSTHVRKAMYRDH